MEKLEILLVDDEREITDLVELYLVNEGYRVHKAHCAEDAYRLLRENNVRLVVLDIMMPGIDGLEACRNIRKERNIPIIMLSAKSEDIDKIMGLSTGADDYMTKPFNPLELTARIKSQLRRFLFLNPYGAGQADRMPIDIEGLMIEPYSRFVTVYGTEVTLTPREYDILFLLAGNRGRIFRAEEIFERIWKEPCLDSKNTVMVHIRKLREKTEEDPRNPRFIKTVWGVGYTIEK